LVSGPPTLQRGNEASFSADRSRPRCTPSLFMPPVNSSCATFPRAHRFRPSSRCSLRSREADAHAPSQDPTLDFFLSQARSGGAKRRVRFPPLPIEAARRSESNPLLTRRHGSHQGTRSVPVEPNLDQIRRLIGGMRALWRERERRGEAGCKEDRKAVHRVGRDAVQPQLSDFFNTSAAYSDVRKLPGTSEWSLPRENQGGTTPSELVNLEVKRLCEKTRQQNSGYSDNQDRPSERKLTMWL
jgi:hypothetical protein